YLTSSGSSTLPVVGGPSATTGTASVAQSGVEQVVLQPVIMSSKAPKAKIVRRGRTLWPLRWLDELTVPMSHLTPMVGSTVWPGRHARGRKVKARVRA